MDALSPRGMPSELQEPIPPQQLAQAFDALTPDALSNLLGDLPPKTQDKIQDELERLRKRRPGADATGRPPSSPPPVPERPSTSRRTLPPPKGRGNDGQPPLSFDPQKLPGTVDDGEGHHLPVAFQATMGTPWTRLDTLPAQLTWQTADRNSVPRNIKMMVTKLLEAYAQDHGVPLNGGGSVKLAVQVDSGLWQDQARTPYWVSWARGTSFVQDALGGGMRVLQPRTAWCTFPITSRHGPGLGASPGLCNLFVCPPSTRAPQCSA